MFRGVLYVSVVLGFLNSCGPESSGPDPAAEWRAALAVRKAAQQDPRAAQQWADTLHAFLQRHPDHPRARILWESLEIEHALRLGDSGRPREGAERLRKLLEATPTNRHSIREALTSLENRIEISAEELAQVQKGATPAEVESLLGPPPAGWKRATSPRSESWYYQTGDTQPSAVHFHRGRVIAVDVKIPPPSAG